MRTAQHVIFWIAVSIFLVLTFGQADGDFLKSFYFVTFLLPAAIGTSYFFNYFLVPKYLLSRQYSKFALYLLYTLLISLYLEMLVLTAALIVLANYNYQNLNPYTTNLFLLTSTLYFIVFVNAFILLIKRYQRKEHLIRELETKSEKNQQTQIQIRSDRKLRPVNLNDILYIESLADYVKIHISDEQIITKEKISDLENQLPESFLRIHRSFLVNKAHITSYNKEEVLINEKALKISRTYKQKTLASLGD
ncbi:MAG: LytTR family DNA-binding domain-containing protein [Marinoscillum sp.]